MAATAIANPTLSQVVADLAYVYEAKNVNKGSAVSPNWVYESTAIPVLEDTITFDTGGVTKTEIKLTTKQIVTSSIDKDDSDISYDEVVSLSASANVSDNLQAEQVSDTDVFLVTRSKNAYIKIIDATITSSYQLSNDGVLVKHKVITPSSQGMQIVTAAENGVVAIPENDEAAPQAGQ